MNADSDYAYDIFLSYRRITLVRQWIETHFIDLLNSYLEVELARRPRIFWDLREIEVGDYWETTIADALRRSALMVCILSRPYFSSSWCMAELETFLLRDQQEGRAEAGRSLMLPIQWHDGDSYPTRIHSLQLLDFRKYSYTAEFFRQTKGYLSFETEVRTLAETLHRRLSDAPPFNDMWPIAKPAAVNVSDRGAWNYRL